MLVFWDQRLVFLATPKTGSTAIETALESLAEVAVTRPPVLKHTPALRYRRFLGPYLERAAGAPFTVVALMREPLEWLGSWYRFRQREEVIEPQKSTRGMSFDRFVDGYLQTPRPAFADVGGQARFLDPGKEKPLDHIFRYDEIDAFVGFLEDRLGCEITLPVINVSPEGATELSPETEARLRRDCAADFLLYDSLRHAG